MNNWKYILVLGDLLVFSSLTSSTAQTTFNDNDLLEV